MIAKKANDPMWASQHTVLHYNVTVYSIATMTTWTLQCHNCRIEVSLRELNYVLQHSFVHDDGTIK